MGQIGKHPQGEPPSSGGNFSILLLRGLWILVDLLTGVGADTTNKQPYRIFGGEEVDDVPSEWIIAIVVVAVIVIVGVIVYYSCKLGYCK